MTNPQIDRFIHDCLVPDSDTDDGPGGDALYGLYVSWCILNRKVPIPDHAFRSAITVEGLRHRSGPGGRLYPGLRMTGPAATDYIVNSDPEWGASDDGQKPAAS